MHYSHLSYLTNLHNKAIGRAYARVERGELVMGGIERAARVCVIGGDGLLLVSPPPPD